MKRGSQILFIVALVSGCIDEVDDFEDMDQLRPERPECSHCEIDLNASGAYAYLSIDTAYNPAWITNVSITISNAGGSELLDYGSTLSVPNGPTTVTVPDNELCTVGTTGAPPTTIYVEFEITNAAGVQTVGNNVPFSGTCS